MIQSTNKNKEKYDNYLLKEMKKYIRAKLYLNLR